MGPVLFLVVRARRLLPSLIFLLKLGHTGSDLSESF